MIEIEKLHSGFNETAYALPKTDFVQCLQDFFKDEATTRTVLDTFKKMGIYVPKTRYEFLKGTEGVLVFLKLQS